MPALLKIKRNIENDVFKLQFSLDLTSLPESDKELMRKFGEPLINIGGVFLEDSDNSFSLPEKYIRVKSDLPYVQEFDAKSNVLGFVSTQAQAEGFQEAFVDRYQTALSELRALQDNFTGEFTVNI
jgi:hypothetical protein